MPFLLAHMRWIPCSQRCSFKWLDSKMVPLPHGERLFACVALAKARTGSLPLKFANVFLGRATERAIGTIRPKRRFDVSEGGGFILKMSGGKNGLGHGNLL